MLDESLTTPHFPAAPRPADFGDHGEKVAFREDRMTTRTILFDSPLLLGFDQTRALIERVSKAADAYPPYNVEQIGGDRVRISLAVAGFAQDELEITLEGRQLTVAGKRAQPSEPQAFLHRGIAARGFVRAFVLADGLEVDGAKLEHGLLHVDLVRPQAEQPVKRIPITTG
jgi:HSP20 family molecular chaperone IbpA